MSQEVELIQAVYRGDLDESLEVIADAIHTRRKVLQQQHAAENQATMKPGTRVITHNLSPKYLNGIPGTVMARAARRSKDIMVDLDYVPRGRRHYSKQIGIPASCLELASSEESALARLASINE